MIVRITDRFKCLLTSLIFGDNWLRSTVLKLINVSPWIFTGHLLVDNNLLTQKYKEAPNKAKWVGEASEDIFQKSQNEPETQEMINKLLQKDCNTADDVFELNKKLTEILTDIGQKTVKKDQIFTKKDD